MKVNRIFFTIIVISLVLLALFYGGYLLLRGSELTMPALFRPASGARLVMSMDGFKFTQSENGRASWIMHAKTADLFENKEAQLEEVEIVFQNPDNKEAVLRGASGTLDTENGNASIHGGGQDVRIATSDGYLLTTASLFWKAGERLVWTAEPFKLLGSEIYLEGTGFSGNVDLRSIAVKKNVKAVLQE